MARLVWLQDGLTEPVNEPIYNDNPYIETKIEKPPRIRVYHYHNDHLGTPNELTDQDGEVVWLAEYEAWGNVAKVVWREEQLGQLKVSAEELQPLRFQGQFIDQETGLHYNRFRYYDPDLGMFTTRDPIRLMGGSNVFQYAPNPIGWVDPFGLSCISSLPKLRGMSIARIQKILKKAGFTRTNPANPRNQRWRHADGSEVQIHAYGNLRTSPYKSGNNAHVHKSIGKHGDRGTTELADDGITPVSKHSAEAHIGIKNPSDFPSISGRNHGD